MRLVASISFIGLIYLLKDLNIRPGSLSEVSIDTTFPEPWSCERGKSDSLDLRRPATLKFGSGGHSAEQILQHLPEGSLLKMLRSYSCLKTEAKHVTNSIIEARYMLQKFETLQVRLSYGELEVK